jgi:hypothetical protein
MITREDFIFTIGYDGPVAVVDGQAKRRYSSLSTQELAQKGLFRAACASALFSNNTQEMEIIRDTYNAVSGSSISDTVSLQRLFGVFQIDVKRSIIL